MTTFNAIVLNKNDEGFSAGIQALTTNDLPAADVTIAVDYSSLNYKDGLAMTNSAPVVRSFPMVPGIDLVGTVESTESDTFAVGQSVVLTGWGVGEKHWGGYAQKARLKSKWLVNLPEGITKVQSMQIGTAGFTAMLCVMALEDQGVTPDQGEIVVTGAAGGVGSVAVALLSKLGYTVAASTGRAETAGDYLTQLGASRIVGRFEATKRPLGRTNWAGAVDTVGGHTLATVLTEVDYGGSVTACGLAGSGDLPATVYPFILRGVNLLGVDSVMCPQPRRQAAWNRLSELLTDDLYDMFGSQIVSFSEVLELAPQILKGQVRGRVVVDVNRA